MARRHLATAEQAAIRQRIAQDYEQAAPTLPVEHKVCSIDPDRWSKRSAARRGPGTHSPTENPIQEAKGPARTLPE